jgi:glycosyltransferase involved in cell wall biosynthesis
MCRALARRGHAVTVLTTDALDRAGGRAAPAEEARDGVRVLRLPNRAPILRARLNLSTPAGLRAALAPLLAEADAVHCHEFRTVENLLAVPLAAQRGIPLALSAHGTLARATGRSALKRGWDALFSPALARRFAAVIGLTAQEADEARALWTALGAAASAAFPIVPNGIDPDDYAALPDGAAFRARWKLGDGPVVLFLGRLHARKGPRLLAEAFRAADAPRARLVFAGPDEGEAAHIAALNDPRIVLTGYVDGADRLGALAAADLLALPAVGEGLPMAALEALAAGLPLVLSPGCGLPEAAQSGAALETPPALEPLAAALRTLLADPARRATMAAAGRALVRDRFTWDAVAAQLEQVYAELGARQP